MMGPTTEGAMPFSTDDAPERMSQRRAVRLWTTTLIVLCIGTLFLLFRHIDRTLPYPYHADEGFISGPASKVLMAGELRPQRFNYPSLPTYIAAGAMAAGFLRGAAHLEIRDISKLGEVGYPYYETPRAMGTARQAFALLAVICVAMTGLSAWLACRRPAAILLAPVILLASPLFFRHSWTYLNVDIVGTSFVMMTVGACLLGVARPSVKQSAVVSGVLAGLATASKYTLALAILPVLLAIVLYLPRGRMLSGCVALLAMVAAFLAAVPYSLVDIPGFLNGIGYETFHYASGHAGFAGEPGLPQLLYYMRHFLSEFGYGVAALALVGLFAFPRADWRRAAVVVIFPAALLWLLSSQRVHFTRNALPIHPFVAMFAAFGLLAVHDWIVNAAGRRGWTTGRVKVPVLAGLLLVLAALPFRHYAAHLRDRTDSRNEAREWIAKNLPDTWTIVVPSELGFDRRGLESPGRHIKVVDLRGARDPDTLNALLSDVPSPAVIMAPHWGADRRSPGQQAANALNGLSTQWRVLKAFGTNDVLTNYAFATAWGDPAFAIAVLK
jgi:4-amino-4-deoxy-L-arabinose transferase-like glycosyltransferase